MRQSAKLAAILALCVAGTAAAMASTAFDGNWRVQLITRQGNCEPTYSWSVAVNDGRIQDPGLFVQAAGAIDPRGRVRLQITHGSDVLAASGRASGLSAQGAWRSPTRQCSGAWSAARS